MALDIGVGGDSALAPNQTEPKLSLEDDGYYWFLSDLFDQLKAETGQYIDLYGNATFPTSQLDALERTVAAAKELVDAQGESWKVHTGTQLLPVRKEVYQVVKREEFQRLLTEWAQVVVRARELDKPVVCFGD